MSVVRRNLFKMGVVICFVISALWAGADADSLAQKQKSTTQIEPQEVASTASNDVVELYRYRTKDGKERIFVEMSVDDALFLYASDNGREPRKVELCYDRYHDGENFLADGWWTPLYYTMSPDGRSLYVVTRMHANSNGWVTEYQLFKIDCESLDARLLAECAAIEVTERGFTTAIARLTNKNKAQFTYQEVWLMHDQRIDWNGNIAATSRKEYNYKQMVKRFAADAKGYKLVKGFKN